VPTVAEAVQTGAGSKWCGAPETAELTASGFNALKTNIFVWEKERGGPMMYMPGFGGGAGSPELNAQPWLVSRLVEQMRVFRQACGNDIGLKLDLNYNFKTDGFVKIASALTPEALGGTEASSARTPGRRPPHDTSMRLPLHPVRWWSEWCLLYVQGQAWTGWSLIPTHQRLSGRSGAPATNRHRHWQQA
jgi:hypothetical protein